MKYLPFLFAVLVFVGCQENEPESNFTGNEITYHLQQASAYEINGSVTFKERKNGSVTATIALKGTDGDARFPVHLHLGNLSTPGAEVALLLSPVVAASGKSETIIERLASGSSLNYKQLLDLEACLKIHLSDKGPDRDVILAGGNIGKSDLTATKGGRLGIVTCKSK
jgi:hypothetical protein